MNTQQLNSLYEERINSLAPYIRYKSDGNEDLMQEGTIGIYQVLRKHPHANNSFLKRQAKWRMADFLKRGRSIDNGFYKRKDLQIIHYNHCSFDDGIVSTTFDNNRLPIDELVINKICIDNLIGSLTNIEKDFIEGKLKGWNNSKINKVLQIQFTKMKEIKREIRFKIQVAFAD
ncbi:MAG: hypothetical protein JRI26_09405 [Deltaproteobacteria bacterium]|nr:hypothetical protein [Deltaproteobacteria bacterium]